MSAYHRRANFGLVVLLLAFLLGFFCRDLYGQPDEFVATIKVDQQDTFSFDGIQFFNFDLPGGGRSVMSIDADLALAKFLRRHQHERLSLTIK